MFDDDYYDDGDPSDYYYEKSKLDDFIHMVFEGYKKTLFDSGNTIKYLLKEFDDNLQNIAFTEDSVISSMFYEAQRLEPKAVNVKLIGDLFLLSFYNLRKEKDIIGFFDKFKEKEIRDIAAFLHKSNDYRKVLNIIMEFYLEIERIEKDEKERVIAKEKLEKEKYDKKQKTPINGKGENDDLYTREDYEEALYWLAVGEGEIDPSEPTPWEKRQYESNSYDDYVDETAFEVYRKKLINHLTNTNYYISLIKDASDLEMVEKVLALQTIDKITDTLPVYNSTASIQLSELEALNRAEVYLENLSALMQEKGLQAQFAPDFRISLVSHNRKFTQFPYFEPLEKENELHSIYTVLKEYLKEK